MEITIKYHSILKRYSPNQDGIIKLTLQEGATIKQVLENSDIHAETEVIILNSKIAQEDTILYNGDVLELYPVMGGG